MKINIILKRAFLITVGLLLMVTGGLFLIYSSVSNVSARYLYSDVDKIPVNNVGLLLGTSKYLGDGSQNYFFYNRIDAATLLYQQKKISYILISGDNRKKNYNEPRDMKLELIKRGIPEKAIYLDYAGLRTLDSVIRCHEIFGQEKITVISQKFHNERAVFIALNNGIEAVAFNANQPGGYGNFKVKKREMFARVLLLLDIYIFDKKPRFLGEKIMIGNK